MGILFSVKCDIFLLGMVLLRMLFAVCMMCRFCVVYAVLVGPRVSYFVQSMVRKVQRMVCDAHSMCFLRF